MRNRIKIWFLLPALIFFAGQPVLAQKSKVLAVLQRIESKKYKEAKTLIEEAIEHKKTAHWYRSHYAKGLLCQSAYEEGLKKKDEDLMELYPDQLYLAYECYEKALNLDSRKRIHSLVEQQYYRLNNGFRTLGKSSFKKKDYLAALKAFEQAHQMGESKVLHLKPDTALLVNMAMSAYKAEKWNKAVNYLSSLHKSAYSSNTSILLYTALMQKPDSTRAEEVLWESLELHTYSEPVVMYLVNLMVSSGSYDKALEVLDRAIELHPENFRFHWSRGLVYENRAELDRAILNFKEAHKRNPEEAQISFHIGLCYYNQGVELQEKSLKERDKTAYMKLKDMSRAKYRESLRWLEQAYAKDPANDEVKEHLSKLNYELQIQGKSP